MNDDENPPGEAAPAPRRLRATPATAGIGHERGQLLADADGLFTLPPGPADADAAVAAFRAAGFSLEEIAAPAAPADTGGEDPGADDPAAPPRRPVGKKAHAAP